MTPQEIIDGCVEQINQSVEEVYKPPVEVSPGFGLARVPDKVDTLRESEIPPYKHYVIRTKEYRDEGCSAFKLIRAMENMPGAKKLFWRCLPETVWNHDFGMRYPVCIGRMRFSIQ